MRIPPQNIEAEMSVLGALLIGAKLDQVESLSPSDFYREAHGRIFEAIQKLDAVDIVTLKDELTRRGHLEECGGMVYLMQLSEYVPTPASIGHYAKIVSEKAVLRRLIETASELATLAYGEAEDVADLIEQAERSVMALRPASGGRGVRSFQEVTRDYLEQLDEQQRAGGGITGLPTGLSPLDKLTCGLQPSDLIILAARPGVGKSALAKDIALSVGLSGASVLFVALEMSAEQNVIRVLSGVSGVSSNKLRESNLSTEEWGRLQVAADGLYDRLILNFADDADMTPQELRSECRRVQRKHGLDLVIVDYLQLLNSGLKTTNRTEEVGYISRTLKKIAKEFNVPVLALSQLNREGDSDASSIEEGKIPPCPYKLRHLRESGSIEQDADGVWFLHRPDTVQLDEQGKPHPIQPAYLYVAKQRMGPRGAVRLGFDASSARFVALANSDIEMPGGF